MKINDIIKDYQDKTLTVEEVKNKYNLNGRQLYKLLDVYKIPRRCTKLSDEEKTSIANNYNNGLRLSKVVNASNRSRATILKVVKEKNINLQTVKYTNELNEKIKKLYNDGCSLREISEVTNIPYDNIQRQLYVIVKGNRKKYIRDETKIKIINDIKRGKLNGKELANKYNVCEATICNLRKKIECSKINLKE